MRNAKIVTRAKGAKLGSDPRNRRKAKIANSAKDAKPRGVIRAMGAKLGSDPRKRRKAKIANSAKDAKPRGVIRAKEAMP